VTIYQSVEPFKEKFLPELWYLFHTEAQNILESQRSQKCSFTINFHWVGGGIKKKVLICCYTSPGEDSKILEFNQ
jgi:hypothetical protein